MLYCGVLLRGQTMGTLHLRVVDGKKEAIPFVMCYFQNNSLGGLSDGFGAITIAINHSYLPDTLVVHHLSFGEQKVYVEAYTDSLTIELQVQEYMVSEAEVIGFSAESMVRKSIQEIPNNYAKEVHYEQGFYRQVHKENGVYVRLIEAMVAVEKQGCLKRLSDVQKERYFIHQIRRSLVYEKNPDQHGDHLVDLMLANPLQYAKGTVLRDSNVGLYHFKYDHNFNEENLVKVFLENKSWLDRENHTGWLIINKEDHAIVEMELASFPNSSNKESRAVEWQFQNGKYNSRYVKKDGLYTMDYCKKTYNHHVMDPSLNYLQFITEETFEWFRIDVGMESLAKKKYRNFSNLYSMSYTYDEVAWQQIELPACDERITQDLEHSWNLEVQFYRGE